MKRSPVAFASVCTGVAVLFVLQAWHLSLAVAPGTDEGVYAAVGRMIWEGHYPHLYVPFSHMPLLPILIGAGLRIAGRMYPLRLLYLAANSLMLVPLYWILRRLAGTRKGATPAVLTALFFYATYRSMLFQDFRFIALRQVSNILLILFLAIGFSGRKGRLVFVLQAVLVVAAGFLFLPALLNIGFVAASLVWLAEPAERRAAVMFYGCILAIAGAAVLAYLLLVPHALSQIVLDQMQRESSRSLRLTEVLGLRGDALPIVIGTIGAVAAMTMGRGFRELGPAMLAIVLTAVLIPPSYFSHYLVIAGPAFAFGVCAAVLALFELTRGWDVLRGSLPSLVVVVFIAWQAWEAGPVLVRQWIRNAHPEYRDFVRDVAAAPDPILILNPILAVDAGKPLLQDAWGAYMRSPIPGGDLTKQQWAALENRLCSVVLWGEFVPDSIQADLRLRYQLVSDTRWGVLLVNARRCP